MIRRARAALVPSVVIILILFAHVAAATVVVDTLHGFAAREPGWSGGLDGLFTGQGGNSSSLQLAAGGRIQWRGRVQTLRLLIAGSYQESDNAVTDRNGMVHLRHNHRLGARWATVSFVQVQANSFQRLTSRLLAGAGLRYDFVDRPGSRLAVGLTPMLEAERIAGQTGHTGRGRLSTFILSRRALAAGTKLELVGYWQPLCADFGDTRTVVNASLAVKVSGAVDLKAGMAVEHDTRPPAGVKKSDWSTYTGFGVVF